MDLVPFVYVEKGSPGLGVLVTVGANLFCYWWAMTLKQVSFVLYI